MIPAGDYMKRIEFMYTADENEKWYNCYLKNSI